MTLPGDSTSNGEPRLRELVLGVLERLEVEGQNAVDNACREHPELAGALRKRLSVLAEVGLVDVAGIETSSPGELAPATATSAPDRIGDFELLDKIGAGGMGVVYRARQLSLQREVAIKLIRPDALYVSGARERFARETEIVAKLQHPGIVPIHVVGQGDIPYYAMELVPGGSLSAALAQLEGKNPDTLAGVDLWRAVRDSGGTRREGAEEGDREPGSLFAGSWEKTCLRVVGQVAEALQHAHDRGVLHRDLKPSNVMLTPSGRVMLVDFGLSQSEGTETMTGSTDHIGSLPYMPPELLSNGSRALDRRSDVYALGVTLYQLLTLELPFIGDSVPAVMARILEGRPPRPRAHHPGLSWEAETVCLAALDRDPDRRYATAAAFASDLSNALHRRPVEARRASFFLRAGRWIQRRPGEALALLLALSLPVLAAVLLGREARNVGAALKVAQDERARAERHHDRSMRVIDEMVIELGDKGLDHVPGMREMRGAFLARGAALYEELLADDSADTETVLQASACDHLRSDLMIDSGLMAEAEELARRGLARLEALADLDPDEQRRQRYLRARLTRDAATALLELEHREEADTLLRETVEILRELLRDDPSDPEVRSFLLDTLGKLAAGTRFSGQDTDALPALQENVAGLRELVELAPDGATRRVLATALHNLGFWYSSEGRVAEATEIFVEELKLRRELLAEDPRDEQAQFGVAGTASALAGRLIGLSRHEEAIELLDIAAQEIAIVRRDFPGVPEYDLVAADIHLNRGAALGRLERDADSLRDFQAAAEILWVLCDAYPRDADYARTLGTTLSNTASCMADLGDPEGALEACGAARKKFERAVALRPGATDWNRWLAIEANTRAKVLLVLERPGDAAESLIRSVEHGTRWPNLMSDVLVRLATCLDRADANDDEQQRTLCELAANEVLAILVDAGFQDERLTGLQTRLEGDL